MPDVSKAVKHAMMYRPVESGDQIMTLACDGNYGVVVPVYTFPLASYREAWQGQMNLFSALIHGTTQPR